MLVNVALKATDSAYTDRTLHQQSQADPETELLSEPEIELLDVAAIACQ